MWHWYFSDLDKLIQVGHKAFYERRKEELGIIAIQLF